MKSNNYEAVILGGGFFGCSLALYLKKWFKKIAILEKGNVLMSRASSNNQARVHNGYHYPRSILTARRSRVNSPFFVRDYADCIYQDFDSYYAIGTHLSKISSNQFSEFCRRIDAEISDVSLDITELFDPNLIEAVFKVKEYAFDADKLRKNISKKLEADGIEIFFGCDVQSVESDGPNLKVNYLKKGRTAFINSKLIYNCLYSQINKINFNSGLPIIPLKHQLTEMVLCKVPKSLEKMGITVMCGPFFSLLPFPPLKLHSLSHVRYTPHFEWQDSKDTKYREPDLYLNSEEIRSNSSIMLKDAVRYLPILADFEYKGSIWEVKTLLPESEIDDSRPILFLNNHGLKNYSCILGGKIDNIYDILNEIDATIK